MAKITKPKRGQRPTKRLDLTDMRELFKDRRMWGSIGIVVKPDDGEHFEQVEGPADVLVEVMLQPSLMPVTCRLGAAIWTVPNEGEEVAVLLPEGQADFMPVIVCLLSSNSLPSAQGPALDRIAIVRPEVVVHDGTGGAVELALKSDVDELRAYVKKQFSTVGGHTHAISGAATTTTTTVAIDGTAPTVAPPDPVGTSVLKGK